MAFLAYLLRNEVDHLWKNLNNKVNKPKKELSYVEKLEQEVYQLRMENDLLKKWHALMKQWEKEGRH